MHVQNQMHVIAHYRKCVDSGRKNITEFHNAPRQPRFAMFKIFAIVSIASTQPRPAHAAIDQVEKLRLSGIDKLAAGLSHAQSLADASQAQNQCALEVG